MEKRIYAVVAETVWTPEVGVVVQVPGRMAAQAVHAVSRMKMHRMVDAVKRLVPRLKLVKLVAELVKIANEEITTIILSCRDSKELAHVKHLLLAKHIRCYTFDDTNPEVYGKDFAVTTALATVPVTPEQVKGILDYLPLWTPKAE